MKEIIFLNKNLLIYVGLFVCVILEGLIGDKLLWREMILPFVFWLGVKEGRLKDDEIAEIIGYVCESFVKQLDIKIKKIVD